jgi:hypothetical protein
MSVRVLCPSCRTKLAVPSHLTGKVLPCPKCAQPFRCPAPAATPAATAPAAGPNPFAFESPAPGPAPVAPAGGQVWGLGWRLVTRGAGLAYLGVRLALVALFLLLAAGGVFAASWFLHSSDPDQARSALVACWVIAVGLGVMGCLFALVGFGASFLGRLLCCAVPRGIVSRLCIWISVLALLTSVTLSVVAGVTGALKSPDATESSAPNEEGPPSPAPAEAGKDPGKLLEQAFGSAQPALAGAGVSGAVGSLTSLLAELFWLLFLRQVAWLLGNRPLARSVVRFLVFLLVWPLLLACGVVVLALVVRVANLDISMSLLWYVGIPAALFGLLCLVSFVWYFFLVRNTYLLLQGLVQVA